MVMTEYAGSTRNIRLKLSTYTWHLKRQLSFFASAERVFREQETRSLQRRHLSHCQNSEKNCFPTQNFTEIGQSAAELFLKNDFRQMLLRYVRLMLSKIRLSVVCLSVYRLSVSRL